MAAGDGKNEVAMEELTLVHEGFKDTPAAADVDGRDFLTWQRNLGTRSAQADGDVDGADFLAWQRQAGATGGPGAEDLALSGDIDPKTLSGDFDGDGDVDGRDYLVWQRGAKVVEPDTEGSAVLERFGPPEAGSLKAGASEVLMESLVSPRDPATGQASGFSMDDDDPGPSILADLNGETTADVDGSDVFDAEIDVDLDFDL